MSLHAFPSSEGRAQKSSTPVGRGTRETRLPIPVRAGTTLSVPRKSGHQVEGPRRSISPMEKSKRPQESYAVAHAGRTVPTASKYIPNAPHRLSRSPGQPSETPTLVSTKRHGMAIQNRPDLDQKQSSILAMSPSTSEDLKNQTASRTTSRGPAASDQSHPANFIVPELRSLVAAPHCTRFRRQLRTSQIRPHLLRPFLNHREYGAVETLLRRLCLHIRLA